MNEVYKGNDDELRIREHQDQYQIVLPCDVKDFRQFISGLLGKPQEHKGTIDGTFHVEPKDIANIYHLLDQRVSKQNNGSLIHFSIRVLYDDGTSITHNTIRDFESYYPTSSATPTEIVLSFTYLIHFNGRDASEKQSVEVIISTDEMRLHESRAWLSGGVFQYRISHTDRTWASDIANMLKAHADNFVNKPNKIKDWFRQSSDEVVDFIVYITIIITVSIAYTRIKGKYFSGEVINDWPLQLSYNLITLFFAITIFFCISKVLFQIGSTSLFLRKKSFITLVDKDYKKMNETKKKNSKRTAIYIITLALNIATGIAANVIYNSI